MNLNIYNLMVRDMGKISGGSNFIDMKDGRKGYCRDGVDWVKFWGGREVWEGVELF